MPEKAVKLMTLSPQPMRVPSMGSSNTKVAPVYARTDPVPSQRLASNPTITLSTGEANSRRRMLEVPPPGMGPIEFQIPSQKIGWIRIR